MIKISDQLTEKQQELIKTLDAIPYDKLSLEDQLRAIDIGIRLDSAIEAARLIIGKYN